jgi:hypothetical protein
MEFESSMKVHFYILIPAGKRPVDSLLAIIGKEGEIFRHYFRKPAEATQLQTQQTYFRGRLFQKLPKSQLQRLLYQKE